MKADNSQALELAGKMSSFAFSLAQRANEHLRRLVAENEAMAAEIARLRPAESKESLYPDMGDVAVPELGSRWNHSNGDTYTVTGYADMFSENHQKRPPRVIYKSAKTGRTWSREVSDWHRSMQPYAETGEGRTTTQHKPAEGS